MKTRLLPLLALAIALLPATAIAHPGHDLAGLGSGLAHPLSGLDHLLAMLAVGLWAAQIGGRARLALPAAFLAFMALGGILGLAAVPLPIVEAGILASVAILGLALATALRPPLWSAFALVGLLAIFHGHAHAAEMPASASSLAYAAGFLLSTALLHAAGLLAATLLRPAPALILRLAGAAVALCAPLLALGLL